MLYMKAYGIGWGCHIPMFYFLGSNSMEAEDLDILTGITCIA